MRLFNDVKNKETARKYSESNANIRGPGYLPIKITGGEEFKTVEDAKKSSDVKITKPSILPKGFELKAVYSKDATVTQYYMLQEQEFTDETTFSMLTIGFVCGMIMLCFELFMVWRKSSFLE